MRAPSRRCCFPVAVHYKGSGFYSTDYGRGSRKGATKDGDGGGSGEKSDSSEKKEPAKDSGSSDKKPAASGLSPAHSLRSPITQPGA